MTPKKEWMLNFLGQFRVDELIMSLNYPMTTTIWDFEILKFGTRNYYNPHLAIFVKNNLDQFRGKTFVDVGAFTGMFTVGATKNGLDVIALERNPLPARLLILNMIWNNLEYDRLHYRWGDIEYMNSLEYDILFISGVFYGGDHERNQANSEMVYSQFERGKEILISCWPEWHSYLPKYLVEIGEIGVDGINVPIYTLRR
jgi:hypothetical protein